MLLVRARSSSPANDATLRLSESFTIADRTVSVLPDCMTMTTV